MSVAALSDSSVYCTWSTDDCS